MVCLLALDAKLPTLRSDGSIGCSRIRLHVLSETNEISAKKNCLSICRHILKITIMRDLLSMDYFFYKARPEFKVHHSKFLLHPEQQPGLGTMSRAILSSSKMR